MKYRLFKSIITLVVFGCITTSYAQKFDKKFKENFKTNKDVEVEINASNTEINVSTWNKNEVQVEAFVEIEGVTKEEAEKYFKKWNFEALGNAKKVQIKASGSNIFNLKNDFVFLNNMDFDIKIPEIDFSNIDAIVIPEMDFNFDFDFDEMFSELEDIDKMVEKNGNYKFHWKDDENDIEINNKKEWEAFKKTKKYKELKEKMKLKKEMAVVKLKESKDKIRKAIEKSKKEAKIDKEKIRAQLAKAKKKMEKMKIEFEAGKNDFTINGKKVKIKKRLEIKVPKSATFDLNTRHCKVKLPNTVAYGNVQYGTFNANNLQGGNLNINYAPVSINDLNACTLFLNNVTDATIASVTNTTLRNNYSDVRIVKINEKVSLFDKFGTLVVESFKENFGEFLLSLRNSNAVLTFGNTPAKYVYDVNRVKLDNKRTSENKNTNNVVKVNGSYSSIVIK